MKRLASALVLTLAAQANAEVLHDLPYSPTGASASTFISLNMPTMRP